jgi:nicotinamidase-related amidase
MNVSHLDPKKTALLFFDILNGYVPAPEPGKPRVLKPWIQNAVKLSKAGRAAGLPVFFAKGNHRPDNATTALLLTDTNNSLTPWPNGEVTRTKMHVIAGDKSSDVLADWSRKRRLLHRRAPLERVRIYLIWRCARAASTIISRRLHDVAH